MTKCERQRVEEAVRAIAARIAVAEGAEERERLRWMMHGVGAVVLACGESVEDWTLLRDTALAAARVEVAREREV